MVRAQFFGIIFLKILSKNFFFSIFVCLIHGFFNSNAFAQISRIQSIPAPQAYGAWTKVCSLPLGTPNIQCEVVQDVRAHDRSDITLRVTLYKLPKAQGALMRIFVPIRVELRSGVGMKIDDNDTAKIEYRRCLGDYCIAEVLLKETRLKSLLAGKKVTYFIFTTPEQGIGSSVDLYGLNAAYAALPT